MNSKRSRAYVTGLVVCLGALTTACGTNSESYYAGISQTADTTSVDTKALSNWREYPALSLRSQWQKMNRTSMELEVGLNWLGFGGEVQALSMFRLSTAGSVELVKHITSADSKIFKDNLGNIAVTAAEPVSARCDYESEAVILLEGGGSVTISGVQVEHLRGDAKVLEVSTTGKTFNVPDGSSLQSLEEFCRTDFESVMRPIVERDVAAGIKSKLRIDQFDDSRLNALRLVLQDQEATLEHEGFGWIAEPVAINPESDVISVRGQLRRRGHLGNQPYAYHFAFDRDTHKMMKVDIAPRGVDEESRAAMSLAGFLARNAAEKYLADDKGRPFVIDTRSIKTFH